MLLRALCCWLLLVPALAAAPLEFQGDRALGHVKTLVELGPRALGAPGHKAARDWFQNELKGGQWLVQTWTHSAVGDRDYELYNLIYRFNPEAKSRILIGSHYDSRTQADKDPGQPQAPLPGANDGASGVAVMLELGRLLQAQPLRHIGVDLVFFDGEEGEPLKKRPWYPLGSYRFAERLPQVYPQGLPRLAIVVDMVCDKELDLYQDHYSLASAPWAVQEIWALGGKLHPGFRPEPKYSILDDHTALINKGIPSLLLIDFDYPHFHTLADTPDKCSPQVLGAVGQALWLYLQKQDRP